MVAVAIADRGTCLIKLGRLDEAGATYEEAIQYAEARANQRDVAISKGQIGNVRLLQQRYDEALAAYECALTIFTTLSDPGSVVGTWHQIGMAYREAQQLDKAEDFYKQALAFEVQQKCCHEEALTLLELGTLYDAMGRLEDAATCTSRAADLYATLGDINHEAITRNNLAHTLLQLARYDDARREVQHSISGRDPFGHAAQLWVSWDILRQIEQATGHPQAATEAWQRAVQCYLAYRRDGGESQAPGAGLYADIANTIRQGETAAVIQELTRLSTDPDTPAWFQALLPKLLAILHGERHPALADDAALNYDDAVELRLLLEEVGKVKGEG